MPSSSPETVDRWERLVLGTVLLALALGLPAIGLASATFVSHDEVTITISIAPTSPEPTATP